MKYEIHTLGREIEVVESRIDAVWILGARYGGGVVNKAKENGGLVWSDNSVEVNPIKMAEVLEAIRKDKIARGLRL